MPEIDYDAIGREEDIAMGRCPKPISGAGAAEERASIISWLLHQDSTLDDGWATYYAKALLERT